MTTCVLVGALVGCAAQLPTYPRMDHASAMTIIAERMQQVETVWAECSVTLYDQDGARAQLDGVLLAQSPGYLRLRTWKLGHAAFDLVATPDGGWLCAPRSQEEIGDADRLSGESISRAWSLLDGSFFDDAQLDSTSADGGMTVRSMHPEHRDVICVIDDRTLTPSRFIWNDDDARKHASLVLERYRIIDEIVWATRLHFNSGPRRIVVELREISFNSALPSSAFVPPVDAERQW